MFINKINKLNIFPTPSSSIEYPECDGLRGVAILLVFWFHYLLVFQIRPETASLWHLPQIIAYSGGYGVQLFFVLSAYLLFLPQYNKIQKGRHPQPVSHFVIRRFMRIAPLYYLSILSMIFFVDVGLAPHQKFKHTISHLLFIHIFFPETAYSINNVTWSLGVEFLFYLFLPFFIYLLKLSLNLKNIRARYSALFMLFCIPLVAVAITAAKASDVIPASAISFYFGLIGAIVMYRLNNQKQLSQKILTVISLFVITAIILIHYDVFLSSLRQNEFSHQSFVNGIWKISGLYALVLIISAQNDRIFHPVLCFYPLRIIGLVSYEIYLIHLFLLQWFSKISALSMSKNQGHVVYGIIVFLICFMLGVILHVSVSRPFIKISGFMIRHNSGQKIPGWMPLMFASFSVAVIVPTILLIQ